MKSNYLILLVALSFAYSCNRITPDNQPVPNPAFREIEEKIELKALDAYSQFFPERTKSSSAQVLSVCAFPDSSAFIVDLDEEGYVILQNNSLLTPLVVSEFGDYNSQKGTAPDAIVDNIIRQIPSLDFPDDTIIKTKYLLDSVVVYPLSNTRWHQTEPMNLFSPNGVAGCAPVAIAQAMSVFSFPESLSLTYPESDISATRLDWAHLVDPVHFRIKLKDTHRDTCRFCLQLGRLARQLGDVLGSEYISKNGHNATQTDIFNIPPGLAQLGYMVDHGDYQIDSVITSLSNGFPVLLNGYHEHSGGSHIFDVFGVREYNESYCIKVRQDGIWTMNQSVHNRYVYLYCNFGELRGLGNGWYLALQQRQDIINGNDLGWNTLIDSLTGSLYSNSSYMFYNFKLRSE